MKDNDSLAHTTWACKYHIVFASKCRRQVIYGKDTSRHRKGSKEAS